MMGVSSQASSRSQDSSQLIWRETLACMIQSRSFLEVFDQYVAAFRVRLTIDSPSGLSLNTCQYIPTHICIYVI